MAQFERECVSGSLCSCVLVVLLITQSDVPHSFLSLPVLVSPVVLTTHAQIWVRVHASVGAWLLLTVNVTVIS